MSGPFTPLDDMARSVSRDRSLRRQMTWQGDEVVPPSSVVSNLNSHHVRTTSPITQQTHPTHALAVFMQGSSVTRKMVQSMRINKKRERTRSGETMYSCAMCVALQSVHSSSYSIIPSMHIQCKTTSCDKFVANELFPRLAGRPDLLKQESSRVYLQRHPLLVNNVFSSPEQNPKEYLTYLFHAALLRIG